MYGLNIHQISWRNPYILSTGITASYLVLYTAYDKKEKNLVFSNLADLFLVRKGWNWTLVEANKALSLSGLTIMLTAFLPEFKENKQELTRIALGSLWIHSLYSYYKFYQFDIRQVFSDKAVKQLSILLGASATGALWAGYLGIEALSASVLAAASTALGVAHFYTMEVDYKYKLQVRPYAYLPFPLAAFVLYRLALPPSNK